MKTQGRITNHGFQPWGGGCQCERCMKKTPRDDFYHASNAEHARDRAQREGLDYETERLVGRDPFLDNTIDRDRSPEQIQALLSKTRAKYPEVFDYD